jgi:DNA-binding transcriptional regulator YiaG
LPEKQKFDIYDQRSHDALMPTKTELEDWLLKKNLATKQAAAIFHVNVRTVQRWLDGTRKVPNWLKGYLK